MPINGRSVLQGVLHVSPFYMHYYFEPVVAKLCKFIILTAVARCYAEGFEQCASLPTLFSFFLAKCRLHTVHKQLTLFLSEIVSHQLYILPYIALRVDPKSQATIIIGLNFIGSPSKP